MEDIFGYRSDDGNCLMVTFDLAAHYSYRNKEYPDSNPMMIQIEEPVLYLIQLGEQHGVEMAGLCQELNPNAMCCAISSGTNGCTSFSRAPL